MLWEDKEIESLVFDRRSLDVLARIIKKGIIDRLVGKISEGKEASVFIATKDNIYRAVKIYKPETSRFFNSRHRYAKGRDDVEFAISYARKEYKNMEKLYNIINIPEPIYYERNIIIMEFLGKDGIPYPQLYKVKDVDPGWFDEIIEMVKKMYKSGYVHGDLSSYNILIGEKIYFIDLSQTTSIDDPKAKELLQRDLNNIGRFFNRDVSRLIEEWG